MKILISAYSFFPSIGGTEEITDLVARGFSGRGHAVMIVTMTASPTEVEAPYKILRQPSLLTLFGALKWCDVYLQEHLSIRLGWPALLVRRPLVIALQTYLGSGRDWRSRLRKLALSRANAVIACSRALAEQVYPGARVIHNAYRATEFRCLDDGERPIDLVFLGRLIGDKGAHVLIDALGHLRRRGSTPSLEIIGGGPEESALQEQCDALGIASQVEFKGFLRGTALVQALNRCRIMVVPSTWAEPFGIVALEGIACGCAVIAADVGGLPEAVGPCGTTFPAGDSAALADLIADLLADEVRLSTLRSGAEAHLAKHHMGAIADEYLEVLSLAYNRSR